MTSQIMLVRCAFFMILFSFRVPALSLSRLLLVSTFFSWDERSCISSDLDPRSSSLADKWALRRRRAGGWRRGFQTDEWKWSSDPRSMFSYVHQYLNGGSAWRVYPQSRTGTKENKKEQSTQEEINHDSERDPTKKNKQRNRKRVKLEAKTSPALHLI